MTAKTKVNSSSKRSADQAKARAKAAEPKIVPAPKKNTPAVLVRKSQALQINSKYFMDSIMTGLRGEYEAIGTAMTSGHCHATETAADTPRPAIASDDEPAVGGAEAGPQEAISPPQTRDGRLQDIDRRIEAITNNCGNPERCDDAIAQLTLERDRLANARD